MKEMSRSNQIRYLGCEDLSIEGSSVDLEDLKLSVSLDNETIDQYKYQVGARKLYKNPAYVLDTLIRTCSDILTVGYSFDFPEGGIYYHEPVAESQKGIEASVNNLINPDQDLILKKEMEEIRKDIEEIKSLKFFAGVSESFLEKRPGTEIAEDYRETVEKIMNYYDNLIELIAGNSETSKSAWRIRENFLFGRKSERI